MREPGHLPASLEQFPVSATIESVPGSGTRSRLSRPHARVRRRHRLHHAKDMLAGHQQEIQAERDRQLDAAREQRRNRRQRAA